MWHYLEETWGIIMLLFFLPGILILVVLALIKKAFGLPTPDRTEETKYPKPVAVISILFWVLLAGWIFYDRQFNYVKYYYACPVDESVKCYELKADVESDEGRVNYVTAYFPNGGYLTFDVCRDLEGAKFECDTEKDGKPWTFQYAKTVKIPK